MKFEAQVEYINNLLYLIDNFEIRVERKAEDVYRTYDKTANKFFGFSIMSPTKTLQENIACVFSNIRRESFKQGRAIGIEVAKIAINELK